jgi:hypothetical protein
MLLTRDRGKLALPARKAEMADRSFEAKVIRRGGAALLLLPAFFFAAILLLGLGRKSMLDHTIEHSRQLDTEFKDAAQVVDAFRAQRGRLPSGDEMERHMGDSGPYIVEAGNGF